MFQGVEGGLTRGGPVPGQVFLCEVDQGVGNIRVIRDKSLVNVTRDVHLVGRAKPDCLRGRYSRGDASSSSQSYVARSKV